MTEAILPIIPTKQVDKSEIERQIRNISLKDLSAEESKKILSLIDLTSLEGKDTPQTIKQLCDKAISYNVAAVCVYPTLVKYVKQDLSSTSIHCASVAGGFPSGQTSLAVKTEEVKYAIGEGADEIDLVISRNKFLQGKFSEVFDEIATIKELCKNSVTLKVILETGELESFDNIQKASDIAIYAGADFIKTSTGKIKQGATLEAICIMLHCIKDYYTKTGKKIGIKPSGGISDANTAVKYVRLVQMVLGDAWLNSKLFRFGASGLADAIHNYYTDKDGY